MTIKQLQKLCHKIAVKKGFWKECKWCKGDKNCECGICNNRGYLLDRNNAEMIALMHSELSEALEELRKKDCKMELVGEELADCVIRILDFCGGRDIDLQTLLEKKIKKNKKRPFKHGKKF